MIKGQLIWALIDNRTGNKNQILAILEKLKLPFNIIDVKYNFLARLPNFLLQILGGTIHLKNYRNTIPKNNPSLIMRFFNKHNFYCFKLQNFYNFIKLKIKSF